MNSKVAKDIVLVAVVGVAYYFVYTSLVGIAAAIAYPDWFKPFAHENKALSLILFSLVTTVPAAALAALLAGFSIVKLTSDFQMWWGVLIVVGVSLFSAFRFDLNGNFIDSLRFMVLPTSVIHVPLLVAWWTFLPLSVALFMWRSTYKSE